MYYKIENKCYFKDIEYQIRKELHSAKESIRICVAWINLKSFEDLLLQKSRSGVSVKILCNDDIFNNRHLNELSEEFLEHIIVIKNPIPRFFMHHKFCIIDDATVITGSYNWSKRAAFHYENIVILKNDFNIARQFKHEFADLEYMGSLSLRNFRSIRVTQRTSKFVLGTYSTPRGILETATLQLWEIDLSNTTYGRLGEIDIPHFFTIMEIDDSLHYTMDVKEREVDMYNMERLQIEKLQTLFYSFQTPVHAIGTAIISNSDEHIEYGEPPEREIYLNWIDMRLKKVLPSSFDAEGDFENLWHEIYL
ncbi:phospholipase D-like domain-containing protein [Klebsiella michiganensis]